MEIATDRNARDTHQLWEKTNVSDVASPILRCVPSPPFTYAMTKSPKRPEIEREKWELAIRSASLGYLGGLNRKITHEANGTKLTEGVGVIVKSGFAVREQLRENRPTLAGTILKKVS